jgi:putative ubiquitin-RnfH superfamily antitoxin RatB of RatAB toxin-antitoxin module
MGIRVTVIYSPGPRVVVEVALRLEDGATLADALQASGLNSRFPELATHAPRLGVWGRKARPDQLLHEGDRVEIYRALLVDPKVARRARFEAQGARSAGLFARRRPGAKAGY